MANSPNVVPKLPSKISLDDKEQVVDANGNTWEYNAEKNEFLYKGQVSTFPDVAEDIDGLVTPDIERTLELIQELSDQGYKFGKFRLKTDVVNPYYFYFHSSDDMIKFVPEAQNKLRIEIDKARLYRNLFKQCCVGKKGRAGEQGDSGRNGKSAANEIFKSPDKAVNGLIIIKTVVPSPINTPISLRLFNSVKKQMAEFLVSVTNSEISFLVNDDVDIEETSLEIAYDDSISTLTASIKIINHDISSWLYKARQRGESGDIGDDGNPFLEIVNELLPDPTLHSTRAIVSIRKSGLSNTVYLDKPVFDKIAVSRLSAIAGNLPPQDILSAQFVSAEITTRSSKDIGFFNVKSRVVDVELPELELPSWTPVPGCGQRNRWSAFRFNWWDWAEAPYMFRIVPTNRPPEKCCEQDFFWCPNVGDQPCGVRGAFNRTPSIEMPKKFQNECICECDNPIEFELQSGGFVFDPLDATSEAFLKNSAVVVSQDSVIDGSSDIFMVDITLGGPVRIEVKIEPKPEVCGGATQERRDCAYKDGKKIHTTAIIQDLTGGIVYDSPQSIEVEDFPGVIDFSLDTQGFMNNGVTEKVTAKARLRIIVNDTFVNLCRGYRVTAAVFKQIK